jgi:cytochrome c-type biogenesis protein CcmH
MSLLSTSLLFVLVAAAMTAAALAFVLPHLWRGAKAANAVSRSAASADIYRAALADLETERDAGRLTADGYAEARVELERRLVGDTAEAPGTDDEPAAAHRGRGTRRAAVAVTLVLPVLAAALYLVFGEPGALRDPRVGAAIAGAPGALTAPGMREDLVRHLADNPRDGRGWVLLGRLDASQDRFAEAAAAFEKALAVAPKIAADPAIWCEFADALGMAQGGSLAGRPRELVMRALAMNPAHGQALEMAGSAAFDQREFDAAARYWRTLLPQLPEGSPQQRELAAAIARAERLASMTGTAPATN